MIDYRKEGHTAVLTINNPPANTFTAESLLSLKERVRALNDDRDIYAVVVTGEGNKFFSAGAELKSFAAGDKVAARLMVQRFGEAFEELQEARPVVIAAINGYAMGGGLECALACDIRIAEEHSQMALPEPAVGLLPSGCGTQTLPWLVGEGWAKRMILTNERVNAGTALHIGLVEEVVGKGQIAGFGSQDGGTRCKLKSSSGCVQQTTDSQRSSGCPTKGCSGVGARALHGPLRLGRPARRRECLLGKAQGNLEKQLKPSATATTNFWRERGRCSSVRVPNTLQTFFAKAGRLVSGDANHGGGKVMIEPSPISNDRLTPAALRT